MPSKQQQLCNELAKEGLDANEESHKSIVKDFQPFPNSDYLSVIFSIALVWAQYAKSQPAFLQYAVDFFEHKYLPDPKAIKQFSFAYGHDMLEKTMINMHLFKRCISKIAPDFRQCSIAELVKFQNKALNILISRRQSGKISFIGPWLFLGPFKIILNAEKRLWANPDMDTIILPTGKEVIRGLRTLIKGTSIIRSLNPHDLVEEEGELTSGYARDCLIHNELKGLAVHLNTRASHINTAIHMMGLGEIVIP